MAYFEIDVCTQSILIQINIPWFVLARGEYYTTILSTVQYTVQNTSNFDVNANNNTIQYITIQ